MPVPEQAEENFAWDQSNINMLTSSKPPYDTGIGTSDLRGIPCSVRAGDGAPERKAG